MVEHINNKALKDLPQRCLSAVILAVIAFIALWQGDMVFTFFIALCAVIMLHEWRALTASIDPPFTLLGIPYILVPSFSLIGLRMLYFEGTHPLSFWPALFVISVVAATDTGAYIAGRTIGGPKLAPRISPGKTWAGLMGGIACGVVVSVLFTDRVFTPGTLPEAVAIGALLSVISQLGDLFESWLKRKAGVKDSGKLLPGHGGLLDRVDGLLFAAPIYFAVCLMAGGKIL